MQVLDRLSRIIVRGQTMTEASINELEAKIKALEAEVKNGGFKAPPAGERGPGPSPTMAKLVGRSRGSSRASDRGSSPLLEVPTEVDALDMAPVQRRKKRGRSTRSDRGTRVSGAVFDGAAIGEPAVDVPPAAAPSAAASVEAVAAAVASTTEPAELPNFENFGPISELAAAAAAGGEGGTADGNAAAPPPPPPPEIPPDTDPKDLMWYDASVGLARSSSCGASSSASGWNEERLFRRWSDKGSPASQRKSSIESANDKSLHRRSMYTSQLGRASRTNTGTSVARAMSTSDEPFGSAAFIEAGMLPAESMGTLGGADGPPERQRSSIDNKSESVRAASLRAREVFAS